MVLLLSWINFLHLSGNRLTEQQFLRKLDYCRDSILWLCIIINWPVPFRITSHHWLGTVTRIYVRINCPAPYHQRWDIWHQKKDYWHSFTTLCLSDNQLISTITTEVGFWIRFASKSIEWYYIIRLVKSAANRWLGLERESIGGYHSNGNGIVNAIDVLEFT